MIDAVVIGAGHNGLVAANVLADAGWSVLALEGEAHAGGAVRSQELLRPGHVHDVFSAFYPMAAVSPALRPLELERWGLEWRRAPTVLANPLPDGSAAVLSTDLDVTAQNFDAGAPGDGDRWRSHVELWRRIGADLVDAFLGAYPPATAGARLAGRLRSSVLDFARFALLPARRMGEEHFEGLRPALILAGNASHSALPPEAVLSGFYGWFMSMIGQSVGFPVPAGGSGRLADALVARLSSAGGRVECGRRVTEVLVKGGRVHGVRTRDGEVVTAKVVLADVGAPQLYGALLRDDDLPPRVRAQLRRFEYDPGTVKLDWIVDGAIPWEADAARRAGTVHLIDDVDHMTRVGAQLRQGLVPGDPHLVVGQMNVADPTRSPEGTHTAWAYSRVPARPFGDAAGSMVGGWTPSNVERYCDRMEQVIERRAPGFSSRIVARHVLAPRDLEHLDANLVGGALNGGSAELYQQLVFRPLPGLSRSRTPFAGLYLASASAHPGGGVHGAPGANAARAALQDRRLRLVGSGPARLQRRPRRQVMPPPVGT